MQVFFARHGQSEANLLNEFSNRGRKHPLTTLGREQAATLAKSLADRGIVHIYASPLLRAAETAEIVSSALNIPFTLAPELAEHDVGVLEGKSDTPSWQRNADLWAEWFERGNHDARIEEGESLNDLRARFSAFIDALYARHAGDTLLVIAHGGVLSAMLPFVCSNVDRAFVNANPLANCALVSTQFDGQTWRCETWCDIRLEDSNYTQSSTFSRES